MVKKETCYTEARTVLNFQDFISFENVLSYFLNRYILECHNYLDNSILFHIYIYVIYIIVLYKDTISSLMVQVLKLPNTVMHNRINTVCEINFIKKSYGEF